jgi:hypothetical protein
MLQVHYDGTVAVRNQLPATDGWLDPATLYRGGTNLGITAMYEGGSGTCTIYGCTLPREYATKVYSATVAEQNAMIAEAASMWDNIGAVSPGTPLAIGFNVYSLLRLAFATGAGSVTLLSR